MCHFWIIPNVIVVIEFQYVILALFFLRLLQVSVLLNMANNCTRTIEALSKRWPMMILTNWLPQDSLLMPLLLHRLTITTKIIIMFKLHIIQKPALRIQIWRTKVLIRLCTWVIWFLQDLHQYRQCHLHRIIRFRQLQWSIPCQEITLWKVIDLIALEVSVISLIRAVLELNMGSIAILLKVGRLRRNLRWTRILGPSKMMKSRMAKPTNLPKELDSRNPLRQVMPIFVIKFAINLSS